ncbi:MAG: HNH endonuclease signature motif containing protein [Pyrinomonadaceae bacterium]
MSSRPAIPRATALDLLFEARYRCACDCEPVSLEKAHIIPWCETQDHSFENLVVLCAYCYTRSHAEKRPESQLRRFKQQPCALERDRLRPMSPEQKALVAMIIAHHPDTLTETQRLRFVSMVAAYAGVNFSEVSVISVAATNSSLVRLEMPRPAAERLIKTFQAEDPRLVSFLDDFAFAREEVSAHESIRQTERLGNDATAASLYAPLAFGPEGGIKLIETARPTPADKPPVTNTKEEGLESLIFDSMTSFGWLAGKQTDYERE